MACVQQLEPVRLKSGFEMAWNNCHACLEGLMDDGELTQNVFKIQLKMLGVLSKSIDFDKTKVVARPAAASSTTFKFVAVL